MVKVIIGDRIAKYGTIAVGCSASIFESGNRNKVLLIRRTDNNKWAVPGGYMEPGESLTEACEREILEETGLVIDVKRLIGVYTSPNMTLEYPDGNNLQLVVLHFEGEIDGGELSSSAETSDARYFSKDEIEDLEMTSLEKHRILDGFSQNPATVVCDDFLSIEED